MSKNDEIIIITAARPGLWMKERFSPSAIKRWLGETFYKDYGKTMEKLRQIDDAIYEWVKDIEQLYKELKQRQKQPGPMDDKRVVDIARLLGGINRRFKKIDRAGDILEDLTESHLKEFENKFPAQLPEEGGTFHELSDEDTKELERFREKSDADDMMSVEAGFWDDLRTKWLTRKMETKSVKERRKAIKQIIDQAGSLVRQMKGTLKNLSKARAAGDVGQYLDALNTISEEQQKFENSFVEVYETYVKEHVDQMLEDEAPDTIVDPQTGEAEAPKTIEEEIVEDLGGKVEPGESVPQDPEEWMASQIMQDDIEMELAPTEPSPSGGQLPPTIPGAPLLPSFTERPPSTEPASIDVELPESSATEWKPPAERHIIPQSKQPKTKRQKQPGERPGKKVKEWQPPSFRDIFVQEEQPPQTEPSTGGPEEVTFEGISPGEMNVDEISSGKGTAHTGPVQVQLARIDRAFRDFFDKTASLPVNQQVKAMLSASAKFEGIDEEISQTFLSLAEQILENAE